MGVTQPALGLRDRKKIKTRDAIRRAAMRLIKANGYASTTIEQIAEAAEVSASTYFRYFPSKEVVLIANDLDQVTVDALAKQPPELSSVQAFRRALETTLATLSKDEWEFERDRQLMVLTIPELLTAQFDEYRRTMTKLAEADCRRLGRDPDDLEVRIFYGALAGGLMAVLDRPKDVAKRMYMALDFIEAGMPLQ
jgi:AcrR family transcriptional regulator